MIKINKRKNKINRNLGKGFCLQKIAIFIQIDYNLRSWISKTDKFSF